MNQVYLLAFLALASFAVSEAQYCTSYYVVRAGDTCYDIAASRGIQLYDLVQLNYGINCNNLQIGQTICLPQSYTGYPYYPYYPYYPPVVYPPVVYPPSNQLATNCYAYYTVRQGDICYNIVNYAGITLYDLYTFNPGLYCDNLQIGQQICLSRR